jgi:hypothetical protein
MYRTLFLTGLFVTVLCLSCTRQKEPSVSLLNDRFMNTNTSIGPGGLLLFKWIAEKGEADLQSFTIRMNGDDLGGYPVSSIPPDTYIDSTFLEGPVARGDYTYAFIATDTDGNIGDRAIVVTVE